MPAFCKSLPSRETRSLYILHHSEGVCLGSEIFVDYGKVLLFGFKHFILTLCEYLYSSRVSYLSTTYIGLLKSGGNHTCHSLRTKGSRCTAVFLTFPGSLEQKGAVRRELSLGPHLGSDEVTTLSIVTGEVTFRQNMTLC